MDYEERSISLSELVKIIFKRVWWVVGVTLAVMLVFIFAVQFWLNRQNQTYTVNYTLEFPGIEDSAYPDGSTVRFSSVVSRSTLEEIVATNPSLSGIDVGAMVDSDDIEFTQSVVPADSSASGVAERHFTITVAVRYFTSTEQAAVFLRAVANYPLNRAVQIANALTHDSSLTVYDSSDTFEDKISALIAQREYLVGMYDEMIAQTSGEYTVGGRTLADYRTQASLLFQSMDEEYLNSLVATSNYVLNYTKFKEEYSAREANLTRQIEENQALIAAQEESRDALIELVGNGQISSADLSPYNELIARYTAENVTLQNQLDSLRTTMEWIESAGDDTAALDADIATILDNIDSYRDLLSGATEIFKSVYQSYYADMCDVTFASNIISAEGGMNIILAAVIGAIIGFVAVSVVICIIDLPKYIKEREAGSASDGQKELPEGDAEDE